MVFVKISKNIFQNGRYFLPGGYHYRFKSRGPIFIKVIIQKELPNRIWKTYTRFTPKIRSYFGPEMFQKIQAPNLKPRNNNENLWCVSMVWACIFWNIFSPKYDRILGVFRVYVFQVRLDMKGTNQPWIRADNFFFKNEGGGGGGTKISKNCVRIMWMFPNGSLEGKLVKNL